MARIELTFAEMRRALKEHDRALPAPALGNLLTLIAQAEQQASDMAETVSEKDEEIASLKNRLEWSEGESALRAAAFLCDWSRGEDPRVVRKLTEAIGGGHASDLSLIFK
jgi:hypothetical protein